jgi:hypothetical protein
MAEEIRTRFKSVRLHNHWPCTVCGGQTSGVNVLNESPDGTVRVCEHCLQAGDTHPMRDLGLRGPGDIELEVWALFLRKRLERREGNHALCQALVHECDVVLQDDAVVVPPFRRRWRQIEAVQRPDGGRDVGKLVGENLVPAGGELRADRRIGSLRQAVAPQLMRRRGARLEGGGR